MATDARSLSVDPELSRRALLPLLRLLLLSRLDRAGSMGGTTVVVASFSTAVAFLWVGGAGEAPSNSGRLMRGKQEAHSNFR